MGKVIYSLNQSAFWTQLDPAGALFETALLVMFSNDRLVPFMILIAQNCGCLTKNLFTDESVMFQSTNGCVIAALERIFQISCSTFQTYHGSPFC